MPSNNRVQPWKAFCDVNKTPINEILINAAVMEDDDGINDDGAGELTECFDDTFYGKATTQEENKYGHSFVQYHHHHQINLLMFTLEMFEVMCWICRLKLGIDMKLSLVT
jgi:hypothetical protein